MRHPQKSHEKAILPKREDTHHRLFKLIVERYQNDGRKNQKSKKKLSLFANKF